MINNICYLYFCVINYYLVKLEYCDFYYVNSVLRFYILIFLLRICLFVKRFLMIGYFIFRKGIVYGIIKFFFFLFVFDIKLI